VLPREGTNLFVDAMCIPKGAKNKANAEAFINFMCATETCVANMDATGYASPNPEANEEMAASYDLTDPEEKYQHDIMFPDESILAGYETYTNLPQDILDMYSDLWTKLKS
jgi:spermidine/putrescine transport system substrate-binding protein